MKIIDLLNKIANNEEVPKKIKYDDTYFEKITSNRDCIKYVNDERDDEYRHLFYCIDSLNDEIEIIEEKPKKIEKISVKTNNRNVRKVANKINEIIDYLLEKESDK